MSTDLKAKDLTRAAALLADATDTAPRTLKTVETTFGRADVAVDGNAADVDFHDRDATVHIRFEGD
jgi:hypothetical protein